MYIQGRRLTEQFKMLSLISTLAYKIDYTIMTIFFNFLSGTTLLCYCSSSSHPKHVLHEIDNYSPVFQTQNNVYEILSDVNSRQDIMDERIANLEDRLNAIQVSMDMLPDLLSR